MKHINNFSNESMKNIVDFINESKETMVDNSKTNEINEE